MNDIEYIRSLILKNNCPVYTQGNCKVSDIILKFCDNILRINKIEEKLEKINKKGE